MKIRTDFVTNSSSSSFIAIKVETAYRTIKTELDYSNMPIEPKNSGYFKITKKELKEAKSIDQILYKVCNWFYNMQEEPLCWDDVVPSWDAEDYEGDGSLTWEDCRQILKFYSNNRSEDLLAIKMNEVKKISFFSRVLFWDEPLGIRLIEYDYDTNRMTITTPSIPNDNLDYQNEEMMMEFNGDSLYDRFSGFTPVQKQKWPVMTTRNGDSGGRRRGGRPKWRENRSIPRRPSFKR